MMIATLSEVWDMFTFYPDELHYFKKAEYEEDSIYETKDMDQFIEKEGERDIWGVEIKRDGKEIILDIEIM